MTKKQPQRQPVVRPMRPGSGDTAAEKMLNVKGMPGATGQYDIKGGVDKADATEAKCKVL